MGRFEVQPIVTGQQGPVSVQIDSDTVTVLDHVYVLCVIFLSDLSLDTVNMFPAFVQHVSTGFANFHEFNGHWATSPPRHLSTLLSQPGWTTATWYSLVHRGLSLTDCSGYLTPLHASSVECASTTMDCRSCYILTCTALMWQIESGTSLPSQFTGVCITRRQST